MAIRLERIRLMPGESFRLLRWTDNVRDVEALGPDGRVRPYEGAGEEWHFHPEMELALVTVGSGTRFVGDSIATFDAPDLVLIGSDVPHYWHGLHDSSGYVVQFSIEEAHPLRRLAETAALEGLWSDARRGIRFGVAAAASAAEHIRAMGACRGVDRLGRFMLTLGSLASAPRRERALLSSKAFIPSRRQSTYHGIRDAIRLILDHFHEPLRLDDVLEHAGMSPATFSRQFRKHTGKTFTRFVNEVRIDSACRQLVQTDRSVSEIAYACGFNNISHFNHQFRALRRKTPRAFRVAHRRRGGA
jgi:AraC-like DNA-binding protein